MKNWVFTIDGSCYIAASADEVVEQMWQSSLFGEHSIDDFRKGFTKRLAIYNGGIVRCGTNQELVEDLVKLGFLTLKS